MNDLQDPRMVEFQAARYEADQAHRDFHEAYAAFQAAVLAHEPSYGTDLDYAVWSVGGYVDSALRAVPKKPRKTPVKGISQYVRMNDGVKGQQHIAPSLVQVRTRVGK